MMVIFLVGLVVMILMRTLRKDFSRYGKLGDLDDLVCFYLVAVFEFMWYFISFIIIV
jgi:hypothetical protein